MSDGVPGWAKGLATVIAALGAALVAIIATGVFDDDEQRPVVTAAPTQQAPIPAAIAVDGSDADAQPDDAVVPVTGEATRDVVADVAEDPEAFDFGPGLRGPDQTPIAEQEGPLATPNFPGCTTRILPTNWSDRTSSVRAVAVHYTAGPNRAGLADMDGLTAFASSPAAGVSWHFLIDAEGHCYYSVPIGKKAWTISALNSQTVNIEVVGTGSEGVYPAGTAGAAKLRDVVRRLASIYGLPLQLGAVSNCIVTRPGIITHWMGGACSGGHVDIKPFSIVSLVQQIAADPCDAQCRERKRLRGVLSDRKRKHAATHAAYQEAGCRGRLHEVKLEDLSRERCQRLKRKGHRQHAGIRHTRRALKAV